MRSSQQHRKIRIAILSLALGLLACISATSKQKTDDSAITAGNWGRVTAPVAGTSESSAIYSAAELFAGPNKFGNYYSGVLPNGRIVKPAGVSLQIGMDPLGAALTPDGKFLITTNDDERDGSLTSLQNASNHGGYSLSVVDTSSMTVVSQINTAGKFFVGLVVTGSGPYTAWVSGGPDNDVKLFSVDQNGVISVGTPAHIVIAPILPSTEGYVSDYTPDAALNTADASGNKPPVPSGFDRVNGAKITYPAGSTLSPDGKFLYVACNGDNSAAVIDTTLKQVVQRAPAGYFPYGVVTSRFGDKIFVTNWGMTAYTFANPTYDATTGKLTAISTTGQNQADGFYVPVTSSSGTNPQTSSISVFNASNGNGGALTLLGSLSQGHQLDQLFNVGDTHPSATAVIHSESLDILYFAKANSDRLAILKLHNQVDQQQAIVQPGAFGPNSSDSNGLVQLADFDLSPVSLTLNDGHPVHGAYPNALVASPDNQRLYVAEAGLNSVAVLDVSSPFYPVLIGRIPTGWYPTALALSGDGKTLYIVNAKGVGEDVNPNTNTSSGSPAPTGLASYPGVDSNYIFGTVQKVDLTSLALDNTTVLANNFALHDPADTSVVPVGGAPSQKIKHVFFILHENKTFDSMLGNLGGQFGAFASTTFNNKDGSAYTNDQYTGVSLNTQLLAKSFATAGNYYSDSEESDAGHQFAASGTATDYTEKTLLVKSGRGLLVNKNFEPEDYPEGGYIFNNAARNGASFKDYGALVRIEGTDTGSSKPTSLNDPPSGLAGFPQLQADNFSVTNPLVNLGDVISSTQGLGQSYFLKLPILSILGGNNPNGEARLDRSYPGYNFNISDQRRALEFINDFDRMVSAGTLPQFIYIYQPNDHTGSIQAPNSATVGGGSALQEIADGDVGLGMVVNHIMKSPIYYNAQSGEGSAIFVTYDDAQSSLDHIHPHRSPLVVVSPYAKPGYLGLKHYVTASVVKTEELLLGLPPNNLGDLFATDLRDLFQPTYNGIMAADVPVTLSALNYKPSVEGKKIWALARNLDLSGPDRDSARLGALIRMSLRADELHREAAKRHELKTAAYRTSQSRLYSAAYKLVHTGMPRDIDD